MCVDSFQLYKTFVLANEFIHIQHLCILFNRWFFVLFHVPFQMIFSEECCAAFTNKWVVSLHDSDVKIQLFPWFEAPWTGIATKGVRRIVFFSNISDTWVFLRVIQNRRFCRIHCALVFLLIIVVDRFHFTFNENICRNAKRNTSAPTCTIFLAMSSTKLATNELTYRNDVVSNGKQQRQRIFSVHFLLHFAHVENNTNFFCTAKVKRLTSRGVSPAVIWKRSDLHRGTIASLRVDWGSVELSNRLNHVLTKCTDGDEIQTSWATSFHAVQVAHRKRLEHCESVSAAGGFEHRATHPVDRLDHLTMASERRSRFASTAHLKPLRVNWNTVEWSNHVCV